MLCRGVVAGPLLRHHAHCSWVISASITNCIVAHWLVGWSTAPRFYVISSKTLRVSKIATKLINIHDTHTIASQSPSQGFISICDVLRLSHHLLRTLKDISYCYGFGVLNFLTVFEDTTVRFQKFWNTIDSFSAKPKVHNQSIFLI